MKLRGGRPFRILLACLVPLALLPHFLLVSNRDSLPPSHHSEILPLSGQHQYLPQSGTITALAPIPLPRKCLPGQCLPRRYFSTTNQHPPMYYLEPNQDQIGRHGMFSNIPSRPWDESSIMPMNLQSEDTVGDVRRTMLSRYNELLESDLRWNSLLPKYLPPQFPQWDRTIHERIVSMDSTILGFPTVCCPTNINHQHLTKNMSEYNVLSEDELNDLANMLEPVFMLSKAKKKGKRQTNTDSKINELNDTFIDYIDCYNRNGRKSIQEIIKSYFK